MTAVMDRRTPGLVLPRFGTPRREYRESDGHLSIKIFTALLGQEPMPHQAAAFMVIGEILTDEECGQYGEPAGTYAYREAGLSWMRQVGKTVELLVEMLKTAIYGTPGKTGRCRALYTAQSGKDAREKLIDDFWPQIKNSPIAAYVARCYQGVGSEKIIFKNDSMITIGNSAEAAVHGKTIDKPIVDELFADTDFRREAAIIPTTMTVHNAQILWGSAAGHAASIALAQKIVVGRQAVLADTGRGTAYFEYSASPEAATYDRDVWFACHPALGLTVPLSAMEHAAETMSESEFRRSWLNIPTERVENQHIPTDLWEAACGNHNPQTDGDKVWAVDVAHDRSHASVALCNTETGVVELTDYETGTQWLEERIDHLTTTHGGGVVYDLTGPAASLDPPGYWTGVSGADVTKACGDFYDRVVAGAVKIVEETILNQALAGAEIRQSGDRWGWSRKNSSTEVSPLMAVTLAATCRPEDGGLVRPFTLI